MHVHYALQTIWRNRANAIIVEHYPSFLLYMNVSLYIKHHRIIIIIIYVLCICIYRKNNLKMLLMYEEKTKMLYRTWWRRRWKSQDKIIVWCIIYLYNSYPNIIPDQQQSNLNVHFYIVTITELFYKIFSVLSIVVNQKLVPIIH